jgi:hypothetical protein
VALKVIIVGMSPSREGLPVTMPGCETWGLPWDSEHWAQFDRLFEMHDLRELVELDGYDMDRLSDCGRLYMQASYAEFPDATPYPFERVEECCGEAYFESSVAYMLALAIAEGAEEISLIGVDMGDDTPHGFQKANAEYLIGMARGKGVKVNIPDTSPLCKYSGEFGYYTKRYGWMG